MCSRRMGFVTRNVTIEPLETLRQLFLRHDIDLAELDFLVRIPHKDRPCTRPRVAICQRMQSRIVTRP